MISRHVMNDKSIFELENVTYYAILTLLRRKSWSIRIRQQNCRDWKCDFWLKACLFRLDCILMHSALYKIWKKCENTFSFLKLLSCSCYRKCFKTFFYSRHFFALFFLWFQVKGGQTSYCLFCNKKHCIQQK